MLTLTQGSFRIYLQPELALAILVVLNGYIGLLLISKWKSFLGVDWISIVKNGRASGLFGLNTLLYHINFVKLALFINRNFQTDTNDCLRSITSQ